MIINVSIGGIKNEKNNNFIDFAIINYNDIGGGTNNGFR